MNKIISLLFFLGVSFCVFAQSGYELYSSIGKVQYKKMGTSEWSIPNDHQALSSMDSLNIPSGGKVILLKPSSSHLYESVSIGKKSVYDFVREARSQASNVVSHVNQTLISEFDKSKQFTVDYNVTGAAFRGFESFQFENEDIISAIRFITLEAFKDETPVETEISAMANSDSISTYFSFENKTADFVFVNILKIDTMSHKVCFLYNQDLLSDEYPYILLAPKSERTIDSARFYINGTRYKYVLFATRFPYDTNMVDLDLNYIDLNDSTPPIWSDYLRGFILLR